MTKRTYTVTDRTGVEHKFTTSREINYVTLLEAKDGSYITFWRKALRGAKAELAGRSSAYYGTRHEIKKVVAA